MDRLRVHIHYDISLSCKLFFRVNEKRAIFVNVLHCPKIYVNFRFVNKLVGS
jgi:hypothetical protein